MSSVNLHTKLSEWIQDRPIWFSYVLDDVIRMKVIDDHDIERYTKLCLQEMEEKNLEVRDIDFELLTISQESEKFSLLEISNVENVNAIASGRILSFAAQGLTVVYGDNGSGKTGYVRALKKACAVAGSEHIKRNIFDAKSIDRQPKCQIKVSTSEEPIQCRLDTTSKTIIRGVSIFDTAVSNDYIGNVREASFEPRVFRVLSEFARIIDLVKSNFLKKKRAIALEAPEIPRDIVSANILKKYLNMNAMTILLDADFIWLEADESELISLKKKLSETDPESKISEIEAQCKSLNRIIQYTSNLASFFSEEKHNQISRCSVRIEHLLEEYNVLSKSFSDNSSDLDRLSLENKAWRNLWKYAREYYISLNEYQDHKKCPLCMQKMSESVVVRFNTIDEYINNKIVTDIDELKGNVKKELTKKFTILDEETLQILWKTAISEDKLHNKLFSKLQYLSSGLKTINSFDDVESYIEFYKVNHWLTDVMFAIQKRKLELDRDKEVLEKLKKRNVLVELKDTILELEARKYLSNNKEKFDESINKLKEIQRLEYAEKTAITNSITRLTSILSSQILLKEYEESFNNELDKLTNGKVKVKLVKAKVGKGRVPFKIIVEDLSGEEHNPRDILSEGEQRVVSIAAYIADNQIGESFGPFVFDDPISSLDFEYEGSTIRRIAELAKTRQVIVFTHRISMVCATKEACKIIDVPFIDVSIISDGKVKGIPTKGILQRTKVKESLKRMLNEDIPKIKKYDVTSREYQLGVSGLCSDFRTIVEKSIEDILMCDITARFERNIRSSNILRLRKLKDYDSEIVDKMMTKYSFYEHSHADETPHRAPGFDDIIKDIEEFLFWANEAIPRLVHS